MKDKIAETLSTKLIRDALRFSPYKAGSILWSGMFLVFVNRFLAEKVGTELQSAISLRQH